MQNEIQTLLKQYQLRVELALQQRLPSAEEPDQGQLHAAMRYACLDGGKRVRAVLVYMTGRALGLPLVELDAPACAIELIHAYSLVHDDLPAMDDDALRRGKPTCHKAFDEATAILTGDALQSLAFEILTADPAISCTPHARLAMIRELAHASGSHGMAGGQAIDIAAEGKQLSLQALQTMHRYKTGALIRASVRLGAMGAENITDTARQQLDQYAEAIGLAFQIRDDILDVEVDTSTLGKPQGSDQAKGKPTYTSLLGIEGARNKATELHQQALQSLRCFDAEAETLRWLADYIVERQH